MLKIRGKVRNVVFAAHEHLQTFERQIGDTLQRIGEEPIEKNERWWRIVGCKRDHRGVGGQLDILLAVNREVKTDSNDGRTVVIDTRKEYETIRVYYFAKEARFVIETPQLVTRIFTSTTAVNLATEFLAQVLQDAGMPELRLEPPTAVRDPEEFTKELLRIAATKGRERLIEANVAEIATRPRNPDLPYYNPIPDKEEFAEVVIPDVNKDLERSHNWAKKGEDLSHNPAVRAQIATGRPRLFKIQGQAERDGSTKTVVRVMQEKQTDNVDALLYDSEPTMSDKLDAFALAIERGDFGAKK